MISESPSPHISCRGSAATAKVRRSVTGDPAVEDWRYLAVGLPVEMQNRAT